MNIKPLESFERNFQSVQKLMNFDREVQDMAIQQIEELHDHLVKVEGITNDQSNGKRTLDILKGIRSHDALRPRYKIIFNQAVVLLVSYFGSALSDCFRSATQIAIKYGDKRILDEELNIDVEELLARGDQIAEILGDLIIQKKDISFQDMKSVHRAFKKYFAIELEKDESVNNIILGQACRHAIVHEGGRVNGRIIRQVSNARPRELKATLNENEQLDFTTEEVEMLGEFMKKYITNLQGKITAYRMRLHQIAEKDVDSGEA